MTTLALREALNDAISSGRFVDTKIVLFSRRDSSGRVCKPKALYANSHVLKSVPYFKDREFPPHPSKVHEVTPSQYCSVRFPRQRQRISLGPTTTSLRRTMATLQTVISKRARIPRAPAVR